MVGRAGAVTCPRHTCEPGLQAGAAAADEWQLFCRLVSGREGANPQRGPLLRAGVVRGKESGRPRQGGPLSSAGGSALHLSVSPRRCGSRVLVSQARVSRPLLRASAFGRSPLAPALALLFFDQLLRHSLFTCSLMVLVFVCLGGGATIPT